MSQLNLLQTFTNEELARQELPINPIISAILDFCEYSIGTDFNASDKSRLKRKNKKKEIAKEFVLSFNTLSR